jgi:hypothetical protein
MGNLTPDYWNPSFLENGVHFSDFGSDGLARTVRCRVFYFTLPSVDVSCNTSVYIAIMRMIPFISISSLYTCNRPDSGETILSEVSGYLMNAPSYFSHQR